MIMSRCASAMYVYCLTCTDIVYYVTILFTMLRYCLLCTDIVYYVTVCLSTLLIISLEINITTTSVVGNPQLITLRIFSTHHACVNCQRNRRSHVIVLKHFDKALTTVFIANQITGLRCFCIQKGIPCKLQEPPFFCIAFSPQRRRLTISNDDFHW